MYSNSEFVERSSTVYGIIAFWFFCADKFVCMHAFVHINFDVSMVFTDGLHHYLASTVDESEPPAKRRKLEL